MATVALSGIITPTNVVTATSTTTLTNKTISGASNTVTNIPLSTGVTGTLPIANGGTNSTATATAGGVGYGTGTAHDYTSAGTTGQFLQSNGASAPTWVAAPSGGFTLGTPVATTSGTSIDFTGIPAGVKQIIVSFNGVSTSGTSAKTIQIGDSGGIEITGYDACGAAMTSGAQDVNSSSVGFIVLSELASHVLVGSATLTLENSSLNSWALTGNFSDGGTGRVFATSGAKSLSAVLDRVRITTNGGANTFDAGEINIAYI